MTIVYLEVKPFKLGNRELAKAYDTLKRQRKLKGAGNQNLTKLGEKAYYIKQNHRYIPLRIQESKLEALVERNHLTESDIRAARGKTSRDLTALEKDLEDTEALPEYNYPALPLISTGDVVNSIKQTISMMDGKSENLFENSFSKQGVDNIDISMAVPIDPDEFEEVPETPVRSRAMTAAGSLLGTTGSSFAERMAEVASNDEEKTTEAAPSPIFPAQPTVPKVPSVFGNPSNKQFSPQKGQPKPSLVLTSNESTSNIKMDGTASIPIWHKTGSDDLDNLRNYVRDLKRAKELQIMAKDSMLINASLVKSGRTKLYAELPKEAESSITKFIAYLQTAYGLTKIDRIKELQKIRQEHNENPHTFLSRVINTYYEAKGITKKTTSEIKEDPSEPDEIIAIYLKGLRNPQVRIQVKARLDDLDLDNIAKVTKNIESAWKDSEEKLGVNKIDEACEVCEDMRVLSINNKSRFRRRSDNPNWRNKTNVYQAPKNWSVVKGKSNGKFKCYKCHKYGHLASACRSKKTLSTNDKRKPVPGPKPNNPKCFKCGRMGHYARNCRSTGKFKSRS